MEEQQREMRQMQEEVKEQRQEIGYLKQQLSNVNADSNFQPQTPPEDSGRNGGR